MNGWIYPCIYLKSFLDFIYFKILQKSHTLYLKNLEYPFLNYYIIQINSQIFAIKISITIDMTPTEGRIDMSTGATSTRGGLMMMFTYIDDKKRGLRKYTPYAMIQTSHKSISKWTSNSRIFFLECGGIYTRTCIVIRGDRGYNTSYWPLTDIFLLYWCDHSLIDISLLLRLSTPIIHTNSLNP